MDFTLTPRQLLFLFTIITLLFSCVLGVCSSDSKPTTCCGKTSAVHVNPVNVTNCAYTEGKGQCREAYVFLFNDGRRHCSSVNAKRIKKTLNILEKKGILCLGKPRS
ncbi:hypothetical protein Q7C36_023273 [Tachysurus vachellii]|uniref:Chemokine interleukin-8-like domain-containing protein n=1 Tax=Tachysurus vachellii TaxID=175792 RepID=A0AA88LGC8_TACVA|nr:hypothetical protein Q7C36_023273 [Tachysurus vachellii]